MQIDEAEMERQGETKRPEFFSILPPYSQRLQLILRVYEDMVLWKGDVMKCAVLFNSQLV